MFSLTIEAMSKATRMFYQIKFTLKNSSTGLLITLTIAKDQYFILLELVEVRPTRYFCISEMIGAQDTFRKWITKAMRFKF